VWTRNSEAVLAVGDAPLQLRRGDPGVHGRIVEGGVEVSGQVSDVSGGQVAIGDKVVQIDGGAHVVFNDCLAMQITRRPPLVTYRASSPRLLNPF